MFGKGKRGQGRGLMAQEKGVWLGAIALAVTSLLALGSGRAVAASPTIATKRIATVGTTTAVLEAEVTTGGKATKYHFEYDTTQYKEGEGKHGTSTPTGELLAPESPKTVKVTIEGLQPGTTYHFRAVASNPSEAKSADRSFTTYSLPLGALPDERAYEQASPIDKNGGDALGVVPFVKAAFGGNGITYNSTSGIPGGVGAQEPPVYLATRTGEGPEARWQTKGLLPPESVAPKAGVLGWTPDFNHTYQVAVQFGAAGSINAAAYERLPGGEEIEITPYVAKASYAFAGASGDGGEAIIESNRAQPGTTPTTAARYPFVYAWDTEEEKLSLASVFNKETEGNAGAPATGAFAGPYEWVRGRTSEGGSAALYYTQQEHAVADDGSVFFTTAGSGHIYLREHPTQPQSAMEGKVCKEAAKACTIDVSASQRSTPDAAGPRPAAFQAASADGKTAYFTSSQKLTDDASTGPEVEAPQIGRLKLNGEEKPEEEESEFLKGHHAVGVAVGKTGTGEECLYWADPSEGSIGRAVLGPGGPEHIETRFITPPETEFETHPETEPGIKHRGPAIPRYVVVQDEYVYWTNTGPLGGDANGQQLEGPVAGAGTIGRAKLASPECGALEEASIEPAFIKEASDPQGIAGNASHIYWANAFKNPVTLVSEDDIARATIKGEEVEQNFHKLNNIVKPYGVVLSSTFVYFTKEEIGGFGTVNRIPLELKGGVEESVVVGKDFKPRGIAIVGSHIYWAAQAGEEIGRVNLELKEASLEPEFLKVKGALTGLAADSAESHLYWSANGEILPHPGNDLYRYEVEDGTLTDLTVDTNDPDGAEVQGVLGTSENGRRAYFVANGVLAANKGAKGEEASKGDCEGRIREGLSGQCNLYLWEAGGTPKGEVTFIARLGAGDATDWVPMANSGSVEGVQKSSLASPDGMTLLFGSQQSPTAYDSEGGTELYLYRVGRGITCVSCDPTGAAPKGSPSLGSIKPSALRVIFGAATASRNLADEGKRVFFETPDRLAAADVNGEVKCPPVGSELQSFPACMDVYEWEAPGTGSCTEGDPPYSSQDEGCLYLLSTGKSDWASLFGDASESGEDVFFFTREGLVGQDKDELLDVYDAKVGGGIPSQNPPKEPICESAEACRGAVAPPAPETAAGSATFVGPSNPAPKQAKPKKHKHKKHRHKKHGGKAHRRAGADGRASR